MYAIGIIVSFILYIIVGGLVSKKVTNVEDYYVSGRNASVLFIVGSLIASYLSTVAFMGEAGFSYSGYPIPMLILFAFSCSGYVLGALTFGRYLRRSRSLTVPEYFGKRFDSAKVQVVAALTTIIGISCYLVAVTLGGAILLSEMLDLSYPIALILMWFVYTSFTFLSGSKGVILTDTIMFFIFVLGTFIGVPYIIKAAGGWPDAIENTANLVSRPDILSIHGITGANATMGTPFDVLSWAIIMGLVWCCVVAVSPWQSSRYLMAKNEHVVVRSGVVAMIVALVFAIVLHVGVTTLNVVNPDLASDRAYIWAAMNLMPDWISVIVLSGILAAGISSCSTFLQLIGNSVTNDILVIYKKNKYTDKQLLKISRLSMLIVSVIILVVTFLEPSSIMWLGYLAATLFAASWGPVAFTSIYSKHVTKDAAFWSIIAGFLGVILAEVMTLVGITFPIFLGDPAIIGTFLSLGTLIIVSKLTVPTEAEVAFRLNLMKVPEEVKDSKEVRITKKYPLIMRVSGVALIVFAFVFYYLPMQ